MAYSFRAKPWPESLAFSLTKPQRDVLIDHCRGPQLFTVASEHAATIASLMERKLLKGDEFIKP